MKVTAILLLVIFCFSFSGGSFENFSKPSTAYLSGEISFSQDLWLLLPEHFGLMMAGIIYIHRW
jgi:hypothetical protein